MKPYWLSLAEKEIGVTEVDGDGNNPRIVEYFAETKYKATQDSVPWCAAFVSAILEWSGVPSTRSTAARSYVQWGVAIEKPILGCIVILSRGAPPAAHVGFFMYETDTELFLLGGNQRDRVCVKEYKKIDLIGYRVPTEDYWSPEKESFETNPNYS